MDVIIRGDILIFVKTKIWPTHPRVLNTATGCTVFSDTRPHVPATGPAGTEPPRNSSVSVDYCTMRRPMPATGLKMLPAVKSIHCARMMPTAMSPLENLVTDTGPAREDIPGSKDVPPCWSLTRTGRGVSRRPLRIVKSPQPILPTKKMMIRVRNSSRSQQVPPLDLRTLSEAETAEQAGEADRDHNSSRLNLYP